MFLVSPAGLSMAIALAVLAVETARRGKLPPGVTWLVAWALVAGAIMWMIGGLGHTWGAWSVVRKLLAFALTIALPFAAAAGVGQWLARRGANRLWLASALFASGVITALPTPWTGAWLVCLIADDCL